MEDFAAFDDAVKKSPQPTGFGAFLFFFHV
jgi:hypothetical protein